MAQTVRASDVPLVKDSHTIGRKPKNDTPIHDSKLSSVHCVISREKLSGDGWSYWLEDQSSNGTFHNGTKAS